MTHGPPPLAAITPDICCGPRQMHRRWPPSGAYVVAPDTPAAWSFNSAMRALCVMASLISAAVATRWINDGAADTILQFIRSESIAGERIAAKALEPWLVPLRSAELQHRAADAQRLDPIGFRESSANEWSWRRSKRRLRSEWRARPKPYASDWAAQLRGLRSSAVSRSYRISSKGNLGRSRRSPTASASRCVRASTGLLAASTALMCMCTHASEGMLLFMARSD